MLGAHQKTPKHSRNLRVFRAGKDFYRGCEVKSTLHETVLEPPAHGAGPIKAWRAGS